MNAYSMKFDGALLARGFWIYVWRVSDVARTVVYVGRTGDSSSAHASSPFKRLSQHLDSAANAKGNALARQLAASGLQADSCAFELVAVGPLFPEEGEWQRHCVVRDRMAALERAVADHMRSHGYVVIGTHSPTGTVDPELLAQVCAVLDERLLAFATPT